MVSSLTKSCSHSGVRNGGDRFTTGSDKPKIAFSAISKESCVLTKNQETAIVNFRRRVDLCHPSFVRSTVSFRSMVRRLAAISFLLVSALLSFLLVFAQANASVCFKCSRNCRIIGLFYKAVEMKCYCELNITLYINSGRSVLFLMETQPKVGFFTLLPSSVCPDGRRSR